jgi:hypothetical protein
VAVACVAAGALPDGDHPRRDIVGSSSSGGWLRGQQQREGGGCCGVHHDELMSVLPSTMEVTGAGLQSGGCPQDDRRARSTWWRRRWGYANDAFSIDDYIISNIAPRFL